MSPTDAGPLIQKANQQMSSLILKDKIWQLQMKFHNRQQLHKKHPNLVLLVSKTIASIQKFMKKYTDYYFVICSNT